VTRDGKAAVRVEGNWQTLDQAASRGGGGQQSPFGTPAFDPSVVTGFKLPGAQAEEYLAKATALSRDGDAVTAILSPEAASELLTAAGPRVFGRRRGGGKAAGGGAPTPKAAGRRPAGGGNPPDAGRDPFDVPLEDPRGSVTFRINDGVLS